MTGRNYSPWSNGHLTIFYLLAQDLHNLGRRGPLMAFWYDPTVDSDESLGGEDGPKDWGAMLDEDLTWGKEGSYLGP